MLIVNLLQMERRLLVRRARGGFGLIFTGAYSSDISVDPINTLSANP